MKKITVIAGTLLLAAASVFAQAADDGFKVPIGKDLTDAIKANAAPQVAEGAAASSIKQGIWIETTGQADMIIRDIATGEKKGFELDEAHLLSNANWWFWGDINSAFHLDAEISVWDFDMTLFKANSYAANVPDVTAGDGLQKFLGFFFSPVYKGNDEGIGSLNKMGLGIQTSWIDALLGYGNLKANGMSKFEGIYNVIDQWNDVGKGFTELRTGKNLRKIGDFKINGVAALSLMRGTYGMYDILDVNYKNKYQAALTFGSKTGAEELFYYNDDVINAVSAYFRATPKDSLQFELHGLGTYGSDVAFDKDAIAAAGRFTYTGEDNGLTVSVKESYAGKNVNSVWGSDGQAYDNINADSLTTGLDLTWKAADFVTANLDAGFSMNNVASIKDGSMNLRLQPIADFDFNSLTEKDLLLSVYGVCDLDRLATETSEKHEVIPFFEEAGLEFTMADLGVKKLVVDYAVSLGHKDWESGNTYSMEKVLNSLMVSCDINKDLNVHLGGIYRLYADKEATQVPLGFACGVKINNLPLPGSPFFWTHFCYGMNPYEDNNYSLYRADDAQNKAAHRTYLLNALESSTTKSQISAGLIWSL